MPRIESLFQFIVPLTFLAIWALTSLFNREAPPLPQRPGRPLPPGGGGSGSGLGSSTLRSETLARDANLRWTSTTGSEGGVVRRPVGRPDDEIVIIEETRRPSPSGATSAGTALRPGTGGPGSGSGSSTRRGGRPRPAAPASKRSEPAPTTRPLTGAVASASQLATPVKRPLEVNALKLPPSPLVPSDPRDLARTIAEPTRQVDRPSLIRDDNRLLMSTPARLREAILVSEILQPPLALRRRRAGS